MTFVNLKTKNVLLMRCILLVVIYLTNTVIMLTKYSTKSSADSTTVIPRYYRCDGSKITQFPLVLQKTRTLRVRVPYPHCTGADRTQISYFRGTGPSKILIKVLKKKFFSVFFTVNSENIAFLNHIFFRTLESMLLHINFGCGCEYGCA